ncbi:MAG: hypothetical protein CR982_10800 [Candidatus Cloacimonadota bacterium]|nr:MAG: hypothetical protein CR982_10800 [Candidatus Cloacimonadota bacterium]PIE78963.1 MAG: hypothetical protein CSA15_05125 [Candidatus Delongbacteria bacterium]
MPDWKEKEYTKLKPIIENYLESLNNRDYEILRSLISNDCIIDRGKIERGRDNVVDWLKKLFSLSFGNLSFKCLDVTAGFFSDNEAQIIIYIKIFENNIEKEIFIESLQLENIDNRWLIKRIFGMSYDPDHYNKYFK